MKRIVCRYWIASLIATMTVMFAGSKAVGIELEPSPIQDGIHKLRLEYSVYAMNEDNPGSNEDLEGRAEAENLTQNVKSPGKAFILSLAVPGLGQYYYGSRIKPFVFFGTEVAAWILYFKWHGDGDNITDQYEEFADQNWIELRYEDYLEFAYEGEGGQYRDDDSISAQEITHHLPDTKTQQYYEMIGKYNQFAWGWQDAQLDGQGLYDLGSSVPAITGVGVLPQSAMRLEYEGMRHDANNKYDNANKMLIVSLANHLISAFEAYFVTKSINGKASEQGGTFSRVSVRAQLKSYTQAFDTPFLRVNYRF
jgi:hypothetical protein